MSDSGIKFHIMIGPRIPVPIPAFLASAFVSAEIKVGDLAPAAFQLNFQLPYHPGQEILLGSPLLKTFNRIHLALQIDGGWPDILLYGFVTHLQHRPGPEPGVTTLTLTGEDITLAMDRELVQAHHPEQEAHIVVQKVLAKYESLGISANVKKPDWSWSPGPAANGIIQKESDRKFIHRLARQNGFVFNLKPSSWKPFASEAYWGPSVRSRLLQQEVTISYGPQPALTVNMGAHSNVDSIDFSYNSLATKLLSGSVQDRLNNQFRRLYALPSLRPPLAAMPDFLIHRANLPQEDSEEVGNAATSQAAIQAAQELALNEVLVATGELDTVRYGRVLEPHRLVGLRGAGKLYDGFYYVKEVTHQLSPGEYKQRFVLGREGRGTTTPVVRP